MKIKHRRKQRGAASPKMLKRAQAAVLSGEQEHAIEIYNRLLKSDPQQFEAWANLGSLYLEAGDSTRAEQAYSKALELEPNAVPVLTNLATLANQVGDRERALNLYHQALEQAPEDAEIWNDLAQIKRFTSDDADIEVMKALLSGEDLAPEKRMFLSFALGKALEDTGEYDEAFGHLLQANQIKRADTPFELAREEQLVDQLIQTLDAQFFVQRMGMGVKSKQPVFIIGMPRSGTTLVEQILASHSEVHGGGELETLGQVIASKVSLFPDGAEALSGEDFRQFGENYISRLMELAPEAQRITDKMPRNFYFIGMISVALPHARIIHCRRSPMDTCFSCFSLHFPYGQDFSYDLTSLGGYYRNYRRLMSHWHRVLPGRILDVEYEALVTDPEMQARRLIEHCGLEWQEACLEFHNSSRQVATASAAQVREPIHNRSVARWRRFGDALHELQSSLGPFSEDVTGV
jgi:tetratricopeptide (TPR) repeat protein